VLTTWRKPADRVAEWRSGYVASLLAADAVAAQRLIDGVIAEGLPVRTCYLDVLAPAMHELGELWEQAKISIGDEHLATAITQSVLATMAHRLPRAGVSPDGERAVAVVGCGPGDLHGLGARMVGDFLQAAGWLVLDLGQAAPASAFADVAARRSARLVAVSTSRAELLDGVHDVRRALDTLEGPPLLAVGGVAYVGHRERATAVGADLHAGDPALLLEQLAAAPSG
jgi:methanogenic corrinoid protein MtbC1